MTHLPLRVAAASLALIAGQALGQQGEAAPSSARQAELVRMVRQDCGSCHGLKLTGGLGPALTQDALRDIAQDSLVATIFHGRPGTPMPGWKTMISEADAVWIAQQLQAGFPLEKHAKP
ncbi:MAG: cytochrome c [Desulfovibrionaceae bacterium]|nr:cytochrome c [Desulfovibrionaceae bacterium]